ncbi:hypothetical protein VPH35_081656 [Triticum aestivum]
MRRRCGEKTDSIVCGPESSMQGLLGCMESKPEKSCTRQVLKPTSVQICIILLCKKHLYLVLCWGLGPAPQQICKIDVWLGFRPEKMYILWIDKQKPDHFDPFIPSRHMTETFLEWGACSPERTSALCWISSVYREILELF